MTDYIRRYRVVASWIAILCTCPLLVFADHSWPRGGSLESALKGIGFLLILIGAFGRLWSSVYICGRKGKRLATEGPYSMTRNPLYLSSCIAGIGFGIASENVAALSLIVLYFAACYPPVIRREESRLFDVFGTEFLEYCRTTPRFVPRLSRLWEADEVPLKVVKYRVALTHSAGLISSSLVLDQLERLRAAGVIPVFITLP